MVTLEHKQKISLVNEKQGYDKALPTGKGNVS